MTLACLISEENGVLIITKLVLIQAKNITKTLPFSVLPWNGMAFAASASASNLPDSKREKMLALLLNSQFSITRHEML